MELLDKIVNGLNKLAIFAKKALPQMFGGIPKMSGSSE